MANENVREAKAKQVANDVGFLAIQHADAVRDVVVSKAAEEAAWSKFHAKLAELRAMASEEVPLQVVQLGVAL